ncbi:MAG: helix-turn-helix domain-containing protein [Oscillospiraceae bacterium]|nr:helix-turn-helix domain-containing protein [Oscillospiraceae bacterium]
MNLLIVDDEISSIRAVSDMVDWSALGIDQVFTALSAQEARERIMNSSVDILLCDIEMPQESGLDLLEWINHEHLDICCIYMTCYPEFSYAQRAVKLGSTAYLLKPIDPSELEREVTETIAKKQELSQMRSAHQLMAENEEKNCQQFWRDLFYVEIPSELHAIQSQIERRQLPLDSMWFYCPVLLEVRRWGADIAQEEKNSSPGRYAVHNIAQELFDETVGTACPWHTIFQFGKNAQLALCGGPDSSLLQERCKSFAQRYLKAEQTYLHVKTVCYVGGAITIDQVAEEIESLLRLDSNHLQNQGLVLHTRTSEYGQTEPDLRDLFERWTNLLNGDHFERARQEILDYLSTRAKTWNFNRRWFIYFLNNYAGMLMGYAERHNFPLKQLTADPADAACFEQSYQSLDDMCAWVESSLRQLEQESVLQSSDPVAATKLFIEKHLSNDLDMSIIAENVHLNQDYLTRIFRRKTGVSIKSYVVTRRMEKAKELLENSQLPITDVAYQVGYYNYTSFNRVFKRFYGESPQGFRKQLNL